MQTDAIKHVVIAGSDAPAWLTALILLRALGQNRDQTGLTVEVVEIRSALRPADVTVTLPSLRAFHRMLGLDQAELIAATDATYSLGQRYAGFVGSRPAYLATYATAGVPQHNLGFLQFWLRARHEGLKIELDEFSLGAAAARVGRYAPPPPSAAGLDAAEHGFHMHTLSYVRWLRAHALQRGVKVTPGAAFEVMTGEAGIAGLKLTDGRVIEGDIYIDATGTEAKLISALDNSRDEAAHLPGDRLLVTAAAPLSPLPLHAQISAHRHGWLGLYPLRSQTGMVMGYDSTAFSDDEALQQIATLSGLKPASGAVAEVYRPGRLRRAWVQNTIAVGPAAAVLEPNDGLDLHMVQVALSHLVSLFPLSRLRMPEADLFNDYLASYYDRALDYQATRYHLNRRFGEPLWDRLRDVPVTETVRHRIDLFRRRGLVALYEHEATNEDGWVAHLLGMGIVPEDYDPQVDQAPEGEVIQRFQGILKYVADRVRQMPTHEELLARAAGKVGA